MFIELSRLGHARQQVRALQRELFPWSVVVDSASAMQFSRRGDDLFDFVQILDALADQLVDRSVLPESKRLVDEVDRRRVPLRAVATGRACRDPETVSLRARAVTAIVVASALGVLCGCFVAWHLNPATPLLLDR